MANKFITYPLIISLILTIGLISLVASYARNPNKIFIGQGEITASTYGISFYTKSAETFLIGFPLNDFYYNGISKNHLLSKITENKPSGVLEEILLTFKDLFLNEQHLVINFTGKNLESLGSVNYKIQSKDNQVEIIREITFNKAPLTAVGETITICDGCFVMDNMHRVYFNGEFLTKEKTDLASKFNLTPLILTPDQFFPNNVSEVIVLNSNGETKIKFPVNNNLIFFQETWHQLEIRTPVKNSTHAIVKQTIYL